MAPGRVLYVPGAEQILDNLAGLTGYARDAGLRILGSEDSHSADDPEISTEPDWSSTFPPHCLRGSEGQLRVPATRPRNPLYIEREPLPPETLADLVAAHRGEILFRKQAFDVFTNPNVQPVLDILGADSVVVYGVARDICVRFAVEGFLRRRREEVVVVEDATRALDPERGAALLAEWRSRGVRIVRTVDVVSSANLEWAGAA